MSKIVKKGEEARVGLIRGIDILADAVKITLGPKGRNVIIERPHAEPHITKDGVTVASEIFLEDSFEDMGAQIIKAVAIKTVNEAGDGTTTATILAQAIIKEGIKNLAAGANPMELKAGIDKAVIEVVKSIAAQSTPIDISSKALLQIATVSANGDDVVGKMVSDVLTGVGEDGIVTIEPAKSLESTIKFSGGMELSKGYLSSEFVTDKEKMEVNYKDVYILLVAEKLETQDDLVSILDPFLSQTSGEGVFMIIADDFNPKLMELLVSNKKEGLNLVTIQSPSYGARKDDTLDDISIFTGGKVFASERATPLKFAKFSDLGRADQVIITRNTTMIIGGKGDKQSIKDHANNLKYQMENAGDERDANIYKDRLANVNGAVAVIYIGGSSHVEIMERIDRVDDALFASRAAISEGVVAGGGVALIRALDSLVDLKGNTEDENTGINIIRKAIEYPLAQICINGGLKSDSIIEKVRAGKKDFGYNARTDKFEKLIAAGVIDPAKVTRVALQNAASVAATFLTTETVLAIKK